MACANCNLRPSLQIYGLKNILRDGCSLLKHTFLLNILFSTVYIYQYLLPSSRRYRDVRGIIAIIWNEREEERDNYASKKQSKYEMMAFANCGIISVMTMLAHPGYLHESSNENFFVEKKYFLAD